MNKTMTVTVIGMVVVLTAVLGAVAGWWLASHAGHTGAGNSGTAEVAAGDEREILYWVAPMDPGYRRDQPGKSPMGMDLVPVYADEADNSAGPDDSQPSLQIDPAVINNIGVQTAPALRGDLARTIDTVGFITANEDRVGHVHVRSEGWIEHLAVHNEGARVEWGDVLFRFFAPALVSAQDEFVQALASGRSALIDATRRRLLALGLLPEQIAQLQRSREVQRLIEVTAPQSGYVTELNVRHGMFVTPELMVMVLADFSEIWVDVDVFESQIGAVAPGQTARMRLDSAPEREWVGEVDYVYPTIRTESRTARLRLVFDNPDLALKPGMYAKVTIAAAPREHVVHVPRQAVIRTGDQERVILALGDGRFRPAEVRTGLESGERVEVLEGLAEGETIVVSSQFLIDSEASLDASLLRMVGPPAADSTPSGDMDGMDGMMPSDSGMDGDMKGMDATGSSPGAAGAAPANGAGS